MQNISTTEPSDWAFWTSSPARMGKRKILTLIASSNQEICGKTREAGYLIRKSPKAFSLWAVVLPFYFHILSLFLPYDFLFLLFLPARDSFLFWVIQCPGKKFIVVTRRYIPLLPSPTLNVKPEK